MSESDEDDDDLNDEEVDNKSRKSCDFGEKCFRKNQSHRNEFAHPGDSDYHSEAEDDKKDKKSTKKAIPKKSLVGRPKREAAKRGLFLIVYFIHY
jgi:hypothetical protein